MVRYGPETSRVALIVLCLLGMLALVAACSPRAQEARLLLEDIEAGAQPSDLKASTPAPSRTAVSWRIDARERRGDLYLPAGTSPLARLVLIPGLSPEGRDDPRLVTFAQSLARVRFAVLVPDIATLRQLRASPEDAVDIADAIRHVAALGAPLPEEGPVAVVAVSYAVGPMVLAALDPAAVPHIGLLLAIGGYYDMTAVVTYITTGRYRPRPGEAWRQGRPDPRGSWHFARANAGRLSDPRDRVTVAALAGRRLGNPEAPIDDLVALLGLEGRAVYALLTNTDPEAVPRLIAALPRAIGNDLAALSLDRRDLSSLRARLLLIHGRDDPVIPAAESRRLAAALPAGQAELTIIDTIGHVEFAERPGLFDRLALLDAGIALLEWRDGVADGALR